MHVGLDLNFFVYVRPIVVLECSNCCIAATMIHLKDGVTNYEQKKGMAGGDGGGGEGVVG